LFINFSEAQVRKTAVSSYRDAISAVAKCSSRLEVHCFVLCQDE